MSTSPLPLRSKRISSGGPLRIATKSTVAPLVPQRGSTSPVPVRKLRDGAISISASANSNESMGVVLDSIPASTEKVMKIATSGDDDLEDEHQHLQFSDDVLAITSPSFKNVKKRSSFLGSAARVSRTPLKEGEADTSHDTALDRARLSPVPSGPRKQLQKETGTNKISPSSFNKENIVQENHLESKLKIDSNETSPTMMMVEEVLSRTPPPKGLLSEKEGGKNGAKRITVTTSGFNLPGPAARRESGGLLSNPARRTSINLDSLQEEDDDEETAANSNGGIFSFAISKRLSMTRRLSTNDRR